MLVRDAEKLRNAFSYRPDYYHFDDHVVNYFDYGPQNSRGFRALKVWLALRQVGRAGYLKMIGDDMLLARHLHQLLAHHPEFEATTQSLSITTFRYVPPDLRSQLGSVEVEHYLNELNQNLLTAVEKRRSVSVQRARLRQISVEGLHRELPHSTGRYRGLAVLLSRVEKKSIPPSGGSARGFLTHFTRLNWTRPTSVIVHDAPTVGELRKMTEVSPLNSFPSGILRRHRPRANCGSVPRVRMSSSVKSSVPICLLRLDSAAIPVERRCQPRVSVPLEKKTISGDFQYPDHEAIEIAAVPGVDWAANTAPTSLTGIWTGPGVAAHAALKKTKGCRRPSSHVTLLALSLCAGSSVEQRVGRNDVQCARAAAVYRRGCPDSICLQRGVATNLASSERGHEHESPIA